MLWRLAVIGIALVPMTFGCSGDDDDRAASSATAGSATTEGATPTTTDREAPALQTFIVRADPVVAEGDAKSVCTTAVRHVAPNHSPWEAYVVKDEMPTSQSGNVHWLFCGGEPGSGIGLLSVRSNNGHAWRLTDLGFGYVSHAGDSVDTAIFDDERAAATADSLVQELHVHAWTTDGGQTWYGTSNST